MPKKTAITEEMSYHALMTRFTAMKTAMTTIAATDIGDVTHCIDREYLQEVAAKALSNDKELSGRE